MNLILQYLEKQAETAGDQPQYSDLEKKAAYDLLLAEGVDFNTATDLIQKEAGAFGSVKRVGELVAGKAKAFGNAVKADGKLVKDQLSNVRTAAKQNKGVFNKGTGSTIKALAKNKAVQVGAGVGAAAVAGGAAALSGGREKQACVKLLMEQGIDFDTAVELTKQAAEEQGK
jgi:hypothetical protein